MVAAPDARRNRNGAVGFDRNHEAGLVESIDEGNVKLQQGLTARADHERILDASFFEPLGAQHAGRALPAGRHFAVVAGVALGKRIECRSA